MYFRAASRSVRDESSWGTGRNRTSGSSGRGCAACASTPHLHHFSSYLSATCCASRIRWPLPAVAATTAVLANRQKRPTSQGPRPRRACRSVASAQSITRLYEKTLHLLPPYDKTCTNKFYLGRDELVTRSAGAGSHWNIL